MAGILLVRAIFKSRLLLEVIQWRRSFTAAAMIAAAAIMIALLMLFVIHKM
jgi:hypothetical protein